MAEVETSYYLRLRVADEPGVLAEITRILADQRHFHRRDAAARSRREGETADRHHHADARDASRSRSTRPSPDRGAAAWSRKVTHCAWKSLKVGRAMRYISTRGACGIARPSPTSCSAAWRPTAGSTCRRAIRKSRAAELAEWRALPYADAGAARSCRKFIDDIPACDLQDAGRPHLHGADLPLVSARRSWRNRAGDITPLDHAGTRLPPARTVQRTDARLQGHGDAVARQPVRVRARQAATKRSTSSARPPATPAARPSTRCAASSGVRVFMLSPHGKMSAFQRAQMYRLQDANIFNIAVDGDVRRLPGHRQGRLQRPRVQGASTRSARSIRSTGRASWRRSSITSRATSPRRVERRNASLRGAVGQLRQRLRRPHRAHDGPADRASWWWRPTRTTCSTSSSAPASTASARDGRDASRRPARRWTSPRRRTSSASCSTCSAATPARVRELWQRSGRQRRLRSAARRRLRASCRDSASCRGAAATPTAWRRSATSGRSTAP